MNWEIKKTEPSRKVMGVELFGGTVILRTAKDDAVFLEGGVLLIPTLYQSFSEWENYERVKTTLYEGDVITITL